MIYKFALNMTYRPKFCVAKQQSAVACSGCCATVRLQESHHTGFRAGLLGSQALKHAIMQSEAYGASSCAQRDSIVTLKAHES